MPCTVWFQYYIKNRKAGKSSTKKRKYCSQAEKCSASRKCYRGKPFSLSKQVMQGNLIEVLEISNGFDNINAKDYSTIDQSNITGRRNSFKIFG